MKLEIICIGDELLIGQTVDTNSVWMAEQLNQMGIAVHQIVTIADDWDQMLKTFSEAEKRSDVVLITGGLGPTIDDLTKDVLCEFFNTELVLNVEVLQQIESYFAAKGREMLESNVQQAYLPKSCTILPNQHGTASGMWFERNNKVFASMPGVPSEMKGIMKEEVLPRLKKLAPSSSIMHKTVVTEGIPESYLAEEIKDWEASLAEEKIKLAYLPSHGLVKLRLSLYGEEEGLAKKKIDRKIAEIRKLIPEHILDDGDINLERSIAKLLKGTGRTLGTAESCTGGYLAHLITSVPQCSNYFKGAVVAYDNTVKVDFLDVQLEEIEKHGAVSKSVVEQMADGARKKLEVDYTLATSGIAGPDGGTADKPVGTIWVALASKDEIISKKFSFGKDRVSNIRLTANAALGMLRQKLRKDARLREGAV